jgi:hypothetical protein
MYHGIPIIFDTYILYLGPGLLQKLKITMPEKDEHTWVLQEMEKLLPASAVSVWRDQVKLWESDNEQINPFMVTVKSRSSFEVYWIQQLIVCSQH